MLIYLQMLDTVEARDKFTSIYLIYRDTLYYTAMSILHNQEDAEDAVHQSFLAILQNIDKFPVVESDSVKAYYMTITVHKAIDIIREPLTSTISALLLMKKQEALILQFRKTKARSLSRFRKCLPNIGMFYSCTLMPAIPQRNWQRCLG